MHCPIKCNTRWSALPAVRSQWGLQSPKIPRASTHFSNENGTLFPSTNREEACYHVANLFFTEERASTRVRDPGAMHKSRPRA